MFKMEISLDEQKIKTDGYNANEIYGQLDNIFESLNIRKIGPGMFEGKGTKQDYGNFGGAYLILKRQKWFMPFVNKWLFYTDTGIEDIAAQYRH